MSTVLKQQPGLCWCGCGDKLTNEKRKFLPGHDARYKSILLRAHRAGELITIDRGNGREQRPALELATAMGGYWVDLLTKPYIPGASTRKIRTLPNSKRERSKALLGQKRTVKIGRWEYEGEVVRVVGNEAVVRYTMANGKINMVRVPA